MVYTLYSSQSQPSTNINSVTPVTIFTQSIPANTSVPGGRIVLDIFGSILNNSGANRTYTVIGQFGGTTFISDALIALPANANRRAFSLKYEIGNSSSAVQGYKMTVDVSAVSAATTGIGDFGTAETIPPTTIVNTGTINQANAQTMLVTITSDNAGAIQSLKIYHAMIVVY